MTNNWTQLILQQAEFDTPISDVSAYIVPLQHLAVLQISGDDSKGFIQNLVTNDVNALAINQGQLSGLCNPKGRLLAVFLLIRRQDCFHLILPKSMSAGVMQRLSMYILRSKVTITDVSEQHVCLGLLPNDAKHFDNFDLPDVIFDAVEVADDIVMKLPSNKSDHYLFIGNSDHAASLVQTAQQNEWQLTPEYVWEWSEIQSGLPMIYPETKEMFTTQQVNLDLVGGVSFNKGCYPGQEIVARLHYLGSPSRRMFVAKINDAGLLETALENGQDVLTTDGTVAGQLVRYATNQTNSIMLLLSLKLTDYQSPLTINGTSLALVSDSVPI